MVKINLSKEVDLFNRGENYKAYNIFSPCKTKKGWRFRLWAPNAKTVSIVGDFNNWVNGENSMKSLGNGIWETEIVGLKIYDNYKYCIETLAGKKMLKADPYALHSETAPENASKLYDITGFNWTDEEFLNKRTATGLYEEPMNIYELHLGSWMRHENGVTMNYKDIADKLSKYVKDMGYTHIEVLPITEFPYEGSWGYQVTGFFAPTSRFGTPKDFMYFVNKMHGAGIGVILDWVIAHFPKDAHGLYEFDGTKLYEVDEPNMCEHKEWGTRIFDYGKSGVKSFLISSAEFWLKEYHIDGIRVDAVASMLYLDYNRKHGEWKPNVFGGNYNLQAIDFLKQLNDAIHDLNPKALMIAEESTAFPLVTKPTEVGGLGFNYKWNMGWMNDMLSYVSLNPFFRKDNHNKVTFSITYAYSENYILPLSHDEVVHGKCSLVNKMPGEYDEKFNGLKAFYAFMIAHPGKKLMFMGCEFAQFIEWDYAKELDWNLLSFDKHKQTKQFVKELNHFYLSNKELYEQDCYYEGFKWVCVDDNVQNIISFLRFAKDGSYTLVIVNFSPVNRDNYKMGVPDKKTYKQVLNTNNKKYGGTDLKNLSYKAKVGEMHGYKNYIEVNIPGNSAMFLKITKK